VDRLVDLDLVLGELSQRRSEWTQRGLVVGEFTWRDAAASWPQPIVADRGLVVDPESLGMTFKAGESTEARLVLWIGGWADLDGAIDGQIVVEAPEFIDIRSCVAVADTLVERLLCSAG
jgi:hypothetical protein